VSVFYTGRSGVGSGPHLDARIWDPKRKQYLDLSNKDNRGYLGLLRSGDRQVLGNFPITSDYGHRDTGIPGASRFHQGVDFGTPEGTEITVQGGAWKEYRFDPKGGGHMGVFGFKGKGGEDLEFVLLHGQERNARNRAAAAGTETLASVAPETVTTTVEAPAAPDWREAASAANRVSDPSNPDYWKREDIRQWAAANGDLAKAELLKRGGDASWLAAAPAAAALPLKTEDRGALNGVQVGGTPPPAPAARPSQSSAALRPLLLELHGDQEKGQSGLIGAYNEPDNPAYQALAKQYGTYGPNYSRNWRQGNLGAPSRGLGIVEMAPMTAELRAQLADPKQRLAAYQRESKRLASTLLQVPDIREGRQQVHFFQGHGDVPVGGKERGAPGEVGFNAGVFAELEAQAKREGRSNFVFHRPELAATGDDPKSNWSKAKAIWEQFQQGGK
jgi:hypothetical protein